MNAVDENRLFDLFFEETIVLRFLNYTAGTIRKERCLAKKTADRRRILGNSKIPPCVRMGRRWIYPKADFFQWAKEQGLGFLVDTDTLEGGSKRRR
jgi:hypothetical protein